MIIWWSSGDNLMINKYIIIMCWISVPYLLIFHWFFMINWWLSDKYLIIIYCWLSNDHIMTIRLSGNCWILENHMMITWQSSTGFMLNNYLMNLRILFDIHQNFIWWSSEYYLRIINSLSDYYLFNISWLYVDYLMIIDDYLVIIGL